METVALMAMIGSAGAQAYGQYQQGKAAADQAETQAAWNEYNAQVADREAEATERANSRQVSLRRTQNKALQGENISLAAEKGSLGGSTLEALAYSAEQLESDLQTVYAEGANKADSLRSRAMLDRFRGSAALAEGSAAESASKWNAGTTLLSGLGQAGMYAYSAGVGAGSKVHKAGQANLGSRRDFLVNNWLK